MALRPPEEHRFAVFHWIQHMAADNAQPQIYFSVQDQWLSPFGDHIDADDPRLLCFTYIGPATCPYAVNKRLSQEEQGKINLEMDRLRHERERKSA
jgi:hypothetical protein